MRIAVIGTGRIGATLGAALHRAGHEVTLGSRHPEHAPDGPPQADVAAALDGAEVVILAVPAAAVDDLLATHAAALDATLLIDATNRIGGASMNASAAIGAALPGVRYVRAFNTLGWENIAEPRFGGVAADLFFSAPQADRAAVEALISDVGLRPAYLGADKAELVDSVLQLWFALVQDRGQRRIAFRVLED